MAPPTCRSTILKLARAQVFGQWKLNEKYDRMASDTSGLGNNGTLYGGAAWKSGILNNGVKFDGKSGYMELPATGSANGFTVSMWAKPGVRSGSNDLC